MKYKIARKDKYDTGDEDDVRGRLYFLPGSHLEQMFFFNSQILGCLKFGYKTCLGSVIEIEKLLGSEKIYIKW